MNLDNSDLNDPADDSAAGPIEEFITVPLLRYEQVSPQPPPAGEAVRVHIPGKRSYTTPNVEAHNTTDEQRVDEAVRNVCTSPTSSVASSSAAQLTHEDVSRFFGFLHPWNNPIIRC